MISPTARETIPVTSELPSSPLVWPLNCGSGTFTEITAVSPSRKSSPEIANFSFLNKPLSSPYFLNSRFTARRKPATCVPPSLVLILFT